MEQYVHLLIPSDRYFAPEPARIAAFFDVLAGSWNYEIVWDDQYTPGVRIVWPADQPRLETDPESGKQFTMMPRFEQVGVSRTAGIAAAFENNPHAMDGRLGCVIAAQGSWRAGELPIETPRTLWPAREQEYACSLGFRLHPEPVCTSDWRGEGGDDPSQSRFGKPAETMPSAGKFTSPKSRRTVELPNAGSARFWVEFSFADWLVPHLPDDFDLLDSSLVRAAEDHFGVKLTQAGRGIG